MKRTSRNLEELCTIAKGKKHDEVLNSNNTYRYIQIDDLHGGSAIKYTTDQGVEALTTDVLIAWDGANAGKVGVGLKGMIGSTLARIRLITDALDPDYFFWFLESKFDYIKSQRTGATIPHVNGRSLKKMKVPLPPLDIQRQIADTLDKADALRRKDQELLQKYDELAQSIFYEMFGNPVKNEKGWNIKPFGKVIKSIRYGTGSPPLYSTEGIPFIRATNIKEGRIVKAGMVYLSLDEARKIEKCYINEGDLIIVRSGVNTGDCGRITSEFHRSLAGYDLIVELHHPYSTFYHYLINSRWGQGIIKPLSRRAAQPHLNAEQVRALEFVEPTMDSLEHFHHLITLIETKRKTAIDGSGRASELFDSLLAKSFE